VIGNTSEADYQRRFDELFPKQRDDYKIVVIEEIKTNKIIGVGTIFFERKFIRQLGVVSYSLINSYRQVT